VSPGLRYICDEARHLVCLPYSVANLHRMAQALGIKKCWFHNKPGRWHYDIPARRIAEIQARCEVVTSRELLEIIRS
jgi:hypothetical protein